MSKDKKAKSTTSNDSQVATLKKVMLSLPTIFALTGTSTVLFFEQTWTRGLEISLPHGVGATSGTSPLLPQILIYLLLIALVLILGAIFFALLLSFCFSIMGGGRAAWSRRDALALAARRAYGCFASKVAPEGAEEAAKSPAEVNQEAIDALRDQREEARSAATRVWKSSQTNLRKMLIWAWEVLFGAADLTLWTGVVRIAVLFAAAWGVLELTDARAAAHKEQLAGLRDAQGRFVGEASEDLACEPLSLTALSFERPVRFNWPKNLGRSDLPCGRVTFASNYPLPDSRLKDQTRAGSVSVPVFHLGRYGDWVVLAPLASPTERVFVQSRQVLEFSKVGPIVPPITQEDETEPEAPAVDLVARLVALEVGKVDADTVKRLIEDALSVHEAIAPWTEDLAGEAAARQKAVAGETEAREQAVAVLIAAREKAYEALRDEFRAFLASETEARAKAWDALVVAVARLSDVLDKPLHVIMPEGGFGGIPEVPGIRRHFANAFRQTMTDDHVRLCSTTLSELPPIVFGEGRVDVSEEDAKRMVRKLAELGWTPDGAENGSAGRFLVELQGFASGTGLSSQNALLAERRADAAKQALVRVAFGLEAGQSADALGPELLTRSGLAVVADGGGEALDGAGASNPRRVTITVCQVASGTTETADLSAEEADVSPLQIKN